MKTMRDLLNLILLEDQTHHFHIGDGTPDEDAIEAFVALGEAQRGTPENKMLRAQKVLGGGVLCYAVEHTGDLTHRITHLSGHGYFGYDETSEKVRKLIRMLESSYGFAREHATNVRNNAECREVSVDNLTADIATVLQAYSKAHATLPVYNMAQFHSREAAVCLGRMEFDRCLKHLKMLSQHLSTQPIWNKFASQYERHDGTVITVGGV